MRAKPVLRQKLIWGLDQTWDGPGSELSLKKPFANGDTWLKSTWEACARIVNKKSESTNRKLAVSPQSCKWEQKSDHWERSRVNQNKGSLSNIFTIVQIIGFQVTYFSRRDYLYDLFSLKFLYLFGIESFLLDSYWHIPSSIKHTLKSTPGRENGVSNTHRTSFATHLSRIFPLNQAVPAWSLSSVSIHTACLFCGTIRWAATRHNTEICGGFCVFPPV